MVARLLTVPELAKYFGIPKGRVYQMLRREADSGFPGFRAGRAWRVDLEQMREWMCRQAEEKVYGVSRKRRKLPKKRRRQRTVASGKKRLVTKR